jgi:hypothetical protein
MAGKQFQHVIKEADAGGNRGLAGSVKIDRGSDVCLRRPTADTGRAHRSFRFSFGPEAAEAAF